MGLRESGYSLKDIMDNPRISMADRRSFAYAMAFMGKAMSVTEGSSSTRTSTCNQDADCQSTSVEPNKQMEHSSEDEYSYYPDEEYKDDDEVADWRKKAETAESEEERSAYRKKIYQRAVEAGANAVDTANANTEVANAYQTAAQRNMFCSADMGIGFVAGDEPNEPLQPMLTENMSKEDKDRLIKMYVVAQELYKRATDEPLQPIFSGTTTEEAKKEAMDEYARKLHQFNEDRKRYIDLQNGKYVDSPFQRKPSEDYQRVVKEVTDPANAGKKATEKDFKVVFGEPEGVQSDIDFTKKNFYNSPEMQAMRHANANKASARDAYDKVEYSQNTIPVGGKQVNITVAKFKLPIVDIGADKYENMRKVIKVITSAVEDKVGGIERIKSIYAMSGLLVVNDILFAPEFDNHKEIMQALPIDLTVKFARRLYAEFFDWTRITRCKKLELLAFDDSNFYISTVFPVFSLRKSDGFKRLFKVFPMLNSIVLENDVITRDSLSSDESKSTERKLDIRKRIMGDFKLGLVDGTDKLRSFSANSFKNYVTNRGDKGILKYLGGSAVRGAFGLFGLATCFTAHFLKAQVKNVKDLWTVATTPVENE